MVGKQPAHSAGYQILIMGGDGSYYIMDFLSYLADYSSIDSFVSAGEFRNAGPNMGDYGFDTYGRLAQIVLATDSPSVASMPRSFRTWSAYCYTGDAVELSLLRQLLNSGRMGGAPLVGSNFVLRIGSILGGPMRKRPNLSERRDDRADGRRDTHFGCRDNLGSFSVWRNAWDHILFPPECPSGVATIGSPPASLLSGIQSLRYPIFCSSTPERAKSLRD